MTRLTRNVLYNLTGQGLVILLSFIAVRFIFRRLGSDAFGIIYFSTIITLVLTSALELGISSTTIREVSRSSDSEPRYIVDLIRTASLFYWVTGGLLLVAIVLAAPLLVTHWINLKNTDTSTASSMLRILSITAVVALPRVLYGSLIRGKQRMGLTNGIDVATAVVQQSGTLALLALGAGVFAVVTWLSAIAVLSTAAYMVMTARIFGVGSLLPGYSGEVVRRNLHFTLQMSAISVLSIIHSQADKIVVSKLLPVADFGFYSFASTTATRATFVTGAISQAAFPAFSARHHEGDKPGLLEQYRKLQDLVTFGTLPVFSAICFAALPVYGYVFNNAVAQRLLLPTALLALGSYFNAMLNIPNVLSLAVGRADIATRLNVYALVTVLPVTVVLIYAYGLPGAGFSWVFYHLFALAYAIPRMCRECIGMEPRSWYSQVLKVLGLGAVTYGVAWLVLLALGAFSFVALGLAYVAATAGFAIGTYLLVGSELRQSIRRLPEMLGRSSVETIPGPPT